MKYVFNRINEHFERTFESAIPQGFSSTKYILQGGVRWYANCPRVLGVVSQFRVRQLADRNAPTTFSNHEVQVGVTHKKIKKEIENW